MLGCTETRMHMDTFRQTVSPDLQSAATLAGATQTTATPVFLMCAPSLYDVTYVINPWMEGNVHRSSRERAHAQWQGLYSELARIARVLLIEPEPGSPDMVFTANAGLVRHGAVAISSFTHPERQGEEPHFRRWFQSAGYRVLDLPRALRFEGEGDALFTVEGQGRQGQGREGQGHGGQRLWVGHGPRTCERSHAALRELWQRDADGGQLEVVGLHLIDPRFYHLDTCFAPLADGSLMYYPGAFDRASLDEVEAFYTPDQRIAVSEADAVCFACNAVNVGETILLNRISAELAGRLRGCGYQVIQLPLDEFLKAGGAAKCLVMKLNAELHSLPAPGHA